MNRLLALLAGIAAPCALQAAETIASSSSASAVATTLEPGKPCEACMTLGAGDKRNWYWKADAPVDFSIDYRDNGTMTGLVTRKSMRGDGGTFTARQPGAYCWTWRAAKPAKLEAKIQ